MGLEHKKEKVQVPHQNEMLSLYCTALGFICKKIKHIILNKIHLTRYFILVLQKVVKQKKIIRLNAVIIHIYYQCARMMMNNISTSSGLSA